MNTPDTPHTPHTGDDDELGAALGASLRGRVDTVPTIIPGFEGVEQRARQITNRRRALAGATVGAFLLLGGIGIASLSGDDSTSDQDTVDSVPIDSVPVDSVPVDSTPVDDDVSDVAGVVTGLIERSRFVRSSILEGVDDVDLYVASPGEVLSEALLLADGSILVEVHDDPGAGAGRVLHLTSPGAEPSELSAFGDLAGGAVVDGVPYAWVGDVPDVRNGVPADDRMSAPLRRVDLRDLTSVDFLDFAYTIESSVETVDVHGTQVLVSISSEAGPEWRILDVDGLFDGTSVSSDTTAGLDRAWGGRFDEEGDGMWFLGLGAGGGPFELVGVNFDGTDRTSVALTPSANPGQPILGLQAENGLIAVNVQVADESLRYAETIWVDGNGSTSNEIEPGEVIFVQAAQTTADNPVSTPPPSEPSDPVETGEWWPLAELGLAGPTPGFDLGVAAPIPTDNDLIGVVDGHVVLYGVDGTSTVLAGDPDFGLALRAADLSLVVELRNRPPISDWRDTATEVIQISDDRYRVLSADGRLNGVIGVNGRAVAVLGDLPTLEDDTGDLRMIDLETGTSTVLVENAYGIEWAVSEVFLGGEATLLVDGSGYQPSWYYYDTQGNVLDLASPTDGRYGPDWANEVDGVGPDADRAALSSDGTTLYWVEIERGGPASLEPVAVVHSMDVSTGDEGDRIEVPLGVSQVELHTDLTISGDELLLTTGFDQVDDDGAHRWQYRAPMVIDLTTGRATTLTLPGADWRFVG
jgi:hypothetical protein